MTHKIIFSLFFLLAITSLFSQEDMPLNNPIYDYQIYHFGFTLGVSNTKFQIDYTEDFGFQNEFDQILAKYEPGFNVGIIMDLRIGDNTNLRLTPSFNFTDQKLYFIKNNTPTTYPENNTGISNFEIPVYLKYRSDRINNGRSYLLVGGNFMLDMSSVEALSQAESLKFRKTNYSIDIGFGIDIYFAYFKFSPEIKYSYGLKNMLIQQNNQYSTSINQLTTRSILISLTFE